MAHQFPLLKPRIQCPGCKREFAFLGQWHPWSKHYLCRECSEAYPMPDIYLPDRNALRRENTPELDAGRTMNVAMENALHRLSKGCVLSLEQGMSKEGLPCEALNPNRVLCYECPKCRRDMAYETELKRRGALHRLNRLGRNGLVAPEDRAHARTYTLSLPFCERCGQVHDEKFDKLDGDAKPYCQQCQDEITVETFWRMRAIFGDDDVESIMDRIERANPHLFERGLLPDMWFELMLKERGQ